MFEEGSYRDRSGHPLAVAVAVSMILSGTSQRSEATDVWGGSLDLTSDYLVRGISRSDDHAALQLDLHLLDSSGLAAGVFASTLSVIRVSASDR
jgi:hypothetical protein